VSEFQRNLKFAGSVLVYTPFVALEACSIWGYFSGWVSLFSYLQMQVVFLLAIVPLVSWSNRFSLRTLLIATTLVAVGLGLIVWLMR
jgi:hypothetical protein